MSDPALPAPDPAARRAGLDPTHDVVIVGGGHNGLTAAAYLAKAGKSVLVLERLDAVGGAAVSAQTFAGVDAWLSRYSYLVSLLPQRIIDDLGLRIRLARRRYSSYTPLPGDGYRGGDRDRDVRDRNGDRGGDRERGDRNRNGDRERGDRNGDREHDGDSDRNADNNGSGRGLLIDNNDQASTDASFERIGAPDDAAAFRAFYETTGRLARALWPTVTEPLLTRSELRALVNDDELWNELIERPIGEFIESRLRDDLVRGVALTDAVIGTFAGSHDANLAQNRCFLYHVIGGGTGEWDVPVGGMGAVTSELARAAREAGARILTSAEVTSISPDGEVHYRRGPRDRTVRGQVVLANVAPLVLDDLLRAGGDAPAERERPEGSQVKVNLLLTRLPRLRDSSVDAAAAFGGTFHINETYSQIENAYRGATRGIMPGLLPCEVYCHTLSDPSILDPDLAASGAQTLTVFGLHSPDRWLTEDNNDATRERLQQAVLDSINSVLAEPIENLLVTDADGNPCIETKTTLDLEHTLAMPGGNIFHGPLDWPFVEDDAPLNTPAERWGVATQHPRIMICGAGARRGGAVSGLGGHNAAMAVLEG